MTIKDLHDELHGIIDDGMGNARVYIFTDDINQDGTPELNAVEAREVVTYKPFWTTVDGYIIQ